MLRILRLANNQDFIFYEEIDMKVIFDMPKTMHPKAQLAMLFKAWDAGIMGKWDVYPRARYLMDKRKVTLKDVIEAGVKYCNIPEGVIKERMRYMKQLNDQKMGE